MEKILVVDDDLSIIKVLKLRLESEGYSVTTATDVKQAVEITNSSEFDLALLDMKLSKANGIELMDMLHDRHPELPVIILTAYGTVESAVQAMKRGAYSYLTKPFDHRELMLQIRHGIEKGSLSREVQRLRRIVKADYDPKNIIGQSEPIRRLLELLSLAAGCESNVYIYGESGTGKGLVAKILHQMSDRKDKPFVPINCAAIPQTLFESELFGFERGAFTGAISPKKGLFVQAHGGVIFLDEISEIPLPMQGKLLKALEDKEFYPLGAQRSAKVDIRIISASNKDLEREVENGKFRQDLFYRIHVIPIKVVPLRDRKDDIPLLVEHFLRKSATNMGKNIKTLSQKAMVKIMLYSWPGNIRELQNVLECAVVMSTGDVITDDLIVLPIDRIEENVWKPFKESKEEFEKNYLRKLMEISRGNISQAAKLAGKYRADLYELLEKHNLRPPDFRQN